MEDLKNNILLNRVFSKNTLSLLLNNPNKSNAFYAVIKRYIPNQKVKQMVNCLVKFIKN